MSTAYKDFVIEIRFYVVTLLNEKEIKLYELLYGFNG